LILPKAEYATKLVFSNQNKSNLVNFKFHLIQKIKIIMIKKISSAIALAVLLVGCVWGCIKDQDGSAAPVNGQPELSIADVNITEGDINDTINILVSLSGKTNTNVVFSIAAIAETATETIDYELLSTGKLVIAQGETSTIIRVKIVGDNVREATEKFQLRLFNPINARMAKDVASISITDDDNNTAGLVIPTKGTTSPLIYAGYNLVWADEFNADTLNTTWWNYEAGASGWGNNELQFYREDNTSLVNGNLVITAKKQAFGNAPYTSSRLTTKGKKAFKFGRIDIRAALPKGQGLWPALWMLGSNIDAVNWPSCGEIDIMELTGNLPQRVLGTAHWAELTGTPRFKGSDFYLSGNDNFQDEFHVFSLNWEADKMEYLVDNKVFYTITPTSLDGANYPFNKNFFFIFNVAVGGSLPGNPDATSVFPQSMIVDYVRVFQK
jgi:Glycosyl hydrolases family 16/Calx-beta domain